MSFSAGHGAPYAPHPASRVRMPRALVTARVLLFVLFGLTVLGVLGVLSVLQVTGEVAGMLVYAAAPGVAGLVLARRAWTGGGYVRWSLIGVQALLVLQAAASIGRGDPRGLAQMAVPISVIVLLSLRPVREWFLLPELEREENPGFSLARMLKWRHSDEGQSTLEYVGMVTLVVAIVVALLLSGVGGSIADGFRSAVCSVTGSGCAAPGGADGPVRAEGGKGDSAGAPMGGGTSGGTAGSGADASDVKAESSDGDRGGDGKDNGDGGGGKSTLDQVGDLFTSPFKVAWGDVKDTAHMIRHPVDSAKQMWNGLSTYTGDWWSAKSDELGKRWDKGGWNYLGVPLEWVATPAEFTSDFLVDSFVDVDSFKKGNWGDGFGNTAWNIGSMFIPGVGEVKWLNKLNKLSKLTKVAKGAERAAEAVEKAREAAKVGDAAGARRAAKEADEAADAAEQEARKSGCTLSAPPRLVPYGRGLSGRTSRLPGGSGSGTTVLASGSSYVVLAQDGCDEDAKQQAQDARQKADEADKVADGVELDQAAKDAKQTIADARDKQKTPKSERFQLDEKKIDQLVAKAKDNPDRSKGEFGKDELAGALSELSDMLKTKNIDNQSRGALGGPVLKAGDRHQLAEAMAEVKAAKRAADNEAAEGTKVYAGIGAKKGRSKVDLGDGTVADVSAIDDADVVYKGKDGNLHVVEVKNTGQAATQASLISQAKNLAAWQKANPGRKARYEIETQDGWDKVFDGFQRDKKTKEVPGGTPAQTLADNGLDLRVAGQDVSPQQLKAMNDAWKKKSPAEQQAARDSGKMKDPKTAMEYLGVS
ncbi:hypothetical protein [Streptomyces sp. NPDC058731]|uniref:hypothetical protein n=1 Tax=Streptomyces sp. NPDC058731 TaxID=3346613 RepID=UPI0036A8739B